jgi:hypothetical protein
MTIDEIQEVMLRLRELIGNKHGAQQRLANQLDIPKQRLSEYLKGQREPTLQAWLKIKELLRRRRKKTSSD